MENREIEEMRSQISLLRNKLEKQQIINDTVLTAAIKNNIAGIERKIRIPLLAGLFALAYCPFAFVRLLNVSVSFVVFTELIIVFSLVETYCQMRLIPTAADRGSDIADFVRRLDQVRQAPQTATDVRNDYDYRVLLLASERPFGKLRHGRVLRYAVRCKRRSCGRTCNRA